MRYLFVFAFAASCTCGPPVVDRPDGGTGGGTAGGTGGGTAGGASGGGTTTSDGGCALASDCTGTRPNVQFCGAAGGLGWSCIDHACLWECNGGRTCDVSHTPDGGCVTCATPGTVCRGQFCQDNVRTATVESSTCTVWPGTSIPFTSVTITGGSGCRYSGIQAAGTQPLGTFEELGNGEFLASFPTFGGTCTGTMLPTGLERWLFNCPDCQFVLRF